MSFFLNSFKATNPPVPSPPALVCDGASFDGTNDYFSRATDWTGAADGIKGLLSLWFRVNGGDGANRRWFNSGNTGSSNDKVQLLIQPANTITLQFKDASSSTVCYSANTTTTFLAGGGWHHLLASWDVSVGISACKLYIDNVDSRTGGTNPFNSTLDYTHTQWGLGAFGTGAGKCNMDMAEFYFAANQWLDLTVPANRLRFRTSSGKPADLGADGSAPTGLAPICYCHLDDGEVPNNFAINRAGTGNWTLTGSLVASTTSPSD